MSTIMPYSPNNKIVVTIPLYGASTSYTEPEQARLANALEADIQVFDIKIPLKDFLDFSRSYAQDTSPKTKKDYEPYLIH